MFKIIPDTEKYSDVENVGRIAYCYLHGKLQDIAGYDCFGFQNSGLESSDAGYIKPNSLEDGIYDCEFESKPCTFFYWKNHKFPGGQRGLVVFNDDEESFKYAEECFKNKVSCL